MGAIIHPVIGNRVYLANASGSQELMAEQPDWHFFWEKSLVYVPFFDDFGPFNLADIHQFVQALHQKLEEFPHGTIVYCVDGTSRELCNAVFLVGCYLIMAMGLTPESVLSCFDAIILSLPAYRDASYGPSDFDLHLIDCWRALDRALRLGWMAEFDMAEYVHYDNVLEGDLHFIIPGKLVAFKGPQSLANQATYQDKAGRRTFAPKFYAEPFADMGVTTVVRLNERQYQDAEFEEHGLQCVALEFEGCTPTPDVVIAFLHTVRNAKGAVAVHCKAGLGRTGTLIALFLMQTYGFSAREAMAWVRIVRPGSIVGEEQHFLASVDAAQAAAAALDTNNSAVKASSNTPEATPSPHGAHPSHHAESMPEQEPRGNIAAAQIPSSAHDADAASATERSCHSAAGAAAAAAPAAVTESNQSDERAAAAAAERGSRPACVSVAGGGGIAQRNNGRMAGAGLADEVAAARGAAAFERAVFRTLRGQRRLSECGGARMRLQSSY